jgi:hypothetical protein
VSVPSRPFHSVLIKGASALSIIPAAATLLARVVRPPLSSSRPLGGGSFSKAVTNKSNTADDEEEAQKGGGKREEDIILTPSLLPTPKQQQLWQEDDSDTFPFRGNEVCFQSTCAATMQRAGGKKFLLCYCFTVCEAGLAYSLAIAYSISDSVSQNTEQKTSSLGEQKKYPLSGCGSQSEHKRQLLFSLHPVRIGTNRTLPR